MILRVQTRSTSSLSNEVGLGKGKSDAAGSDIGPGIQRRLPLARFY